jgi:hypothetical protein
VRLVPISGNVNETWSWWRRWSFAAGVAACLLIGWIALIRGRPVPVLSLVNLGFHELGHLLTYPLPELVTAAMGSVSQVIVPVGLAVYFASARRDLLGAGLCLAWAGGAAQEASVYVADAPFQRLELIGGEHDWAFVLGRLEALDAANELAATVLVLAWVLVLTGVATCVWGLVRFRPSTVQVQPLPAVSVRPISWEG